MRLIAVEEHFSAPVYREKAGANEARSFYITSRSERLGHDIGAELDNLGESRIKQMDAAGIDVQVLSFNAPIAHGFTAQEAIDMARGLNNRCASTIKAHPGRFSAFAALPVAEPEAAADELERCVSDHGFVGAMIHGHINGGFLDDRRYWTIFARAEKLDVPIFLHPALPHPGAMKAYFEGFEDVLARPGWGFAVDTSIHFLRMLCAGVFDAHPKLQFVMGHLGEGLPFAMHRLNEHTHLVARQRGLAKSPLDYIRDHLYVATSGNWYAPAFVCTLMALGAERILWAIDWPYESNEVATRFWRDISLSDGDREKIAHGNAERLFGL